MNKKGQSLIEFTIVILSLISLIQCVFMLFWIFTSLLWMEHQLYQGLICSAQQKEISECKTQIKMQIKRLNPLGTIQSLKIKNIQRAWKGEIKWHFFKRDFFIKQSLSLPH